MEITRLRLPAGVRLFLTAIARRIFMNWEPVSNRILAGRFRSKEHNNYSDTDEKKTFYKQLHAVQERFSTNEHHLNTNVDFNKTLLGHVIDLNGRNDNSERSTGTVKMSVGLQLNGSDRVTRSITL